MIPNVGSPRQEGLIHIAASEHQQAVLDVLIRLGADVNLTNSSGKTALMCAIDAGGDHQVCARTVRLLISRGANVNASDPASQNALTRACLYGQTEVVLILLKAGASPIYRDKYGATPLHSARAAAIVSLLSDFGADLNAKSTNGLTPLDIAEMTESPALKQVAAELRKRGAHRGVLP